MKSKSKNEDLAKYKRIMLIACDRFYPKEANLDDFISKAFQKLPNKMQKQLITYFGIGGGIDHDEKIRKMLNKGKTIPQSERELNRNALQAISQLGMLDYMLLFNPKVKELVEKIAQKTYGEADEVLAVKWAEMYAVMLINGPHMEYDEQYGVQEKEELLEEGRRLINRMCFLEMEYDDIFSNLKDRELSIAAVKHWEEDQDVADRVSIRNFFGIEIPKYLQEFEGEEIVTFLQIRKLKEKIFSKGPWATEGYLFLQGHTSKNIEFLQKIYELIRNGVKTERAEPRIFPFGTGKREIKWLRIRDGDNSYEFPYYEEVMFLRFVD